jgi:iron complex transport system substrate-binding protein
MARKSPAAPTVVAALVLALLFGFGGTPPQAAPAVKPPFPVTVHAANGDVRIMSRPSRIVSLSPTSTEMLFAIDAGWQVIAVDDQSSYPPSAPRTSLSGYRPNAEAIAGYRPDLVLVSSNNAGIVPALERLRIPVLLEPAAADLGHAYAQIRRLGVATGHRTAAGGLVARMRTRIATLVARTPHATTSLSVYHELTPDYYSATSKTFIGQVYRAFGLHNIADAAGSRVTDYPKLAGEYIIAANPDLIFLADVKCCGQGPEAVAARPGWRNIRAVDRGRVVALDDDVASRWGPRIVQLYALVAAHVRAVAQG